jgi:uncharacterized membrane protein
LVLLLPKLSILSVPDEGYSRNVLCALNFMSLDVFILIFSGSRMLFRRNSRFSTTALGCFKNAFNSIGQKYENGKFYSFITFILKKMELKIVISLSFLLTWNQLATS